jgi:hypothetical protein
MKRDLNLVRQMMLALESDKRLNGGSTQRLFANQLFDIPDRDDDELAYHLMLIIDEGWLEAAYSRPAGNFDVSRLTADGHDFVESTRNPDVWQKTKSTMKAGGAETLRLAWDIAKSVVRSEIARHIGL